MSKIKLAIADIDGVLRGKYISIKKFNKLKENNNVGFCSVIFGWDCDDECYDDIDFTGWHTGYHDIITHIDFGTFRHITWEDDQPFYLLDYNNPICPRFLLKNIIKESESMGYIPTFALEYEWFNFKNNKGLNINNLIPITEGNFGYTLLRLYENNEFVETLFKHLNNTYIPIECIHCESGPGVLEAALEYCDALEMADRSVIFKYAVKSIAKHYGYIATFMAKWNEQLPGSGGHIHQSLWDKNKMKNLFYNEKDSNGMSDIMKNYLAGQLYCLPFILPLYAPTINSYKRLVDGYWAPTRVGWGIENRTTTHRVIKGGTGTRIECRVAGADANPYLVIAASLASGLYGIKNKLKLDDNITGNAYINKTLKILPKTLYESIENMKKSEIPNILFGKTFVSHFIKTREWECKKFNTCVSDWELKRYFEII
tara:strand:- start:254 stop:1537 length:1284 start_codon:yes stop_codon:yes gene_type:complete